MERYKGVDREKVLAELREKYPEMPDPGTREWSEFLKRLKGENPEDYRAALLLGGGITKALETEIQRAKKRDAIKSLWTRLFTREHRGKAVPDKRKIGLLAFALVGGLFMFAFFMGTSPKKEATGGGVVKGIPVNETQMAVSASEGKTEATGNTANSTANTQTQPGLAEKGLADMLNSTSGEAGTTGSGNGASPSGSGTGNEVPPTGTGTSTAPGTLPPPPTPVYSGGALPPPPDTSYAAMSAGQTGNLPPPMVIYADPGMPVTTSTSPTSPSPGNTPPEAASTPQATGTSLGLPGGMFYLNYPGAGMMVVTISQQEGMNAVSSQPSETSSSSPAPNAVPSPYPQNAPMPPTPSNPTGGNGW